jgi:deoxyribonuclease (pyrimidine dimer)
MTRINVVPIEELTNKHLVAELHEIMRLPGNLRQSLSRKGKPFSMSEIPNTYTLGTGHVKYFYNKFGFLKKRFELLVAEMRNRGHNPSYVDSSMFVIGGKWQGDYVPDDEAMTKNRNRIAERLGSKE